MKESKFLEFKQEISQSFLKTVSAFANFGGGEIRFGVDDDGKEIGMADPDRACLDIENRINDSISPKPDFSLHIEQQTGVIVLSVHSGRYQPYLYKGKAYRRSDTATVEVDQIELKQLIMDGEHRYFEKLPYKEKELSFRDLGGELSEKLGVQTVSTDVLRTLGLFAEDGRYNMAAALFADRNDFYGTDIVRFGKTISEMYERKTMAGVSILKQYHQAIEQYRQYYRYEAINGLVRTTVELIPEKAFRETVANALVHRAWEMNSHVRISMFPDRIEVVSPGGLPSGLSEQEYLSGYISNLRNPVIGHIFFRLGYIEMFGTGVRRIQEAYAGAERKPTFTVTEHCVMVVLPSVDALPELSRDEETIFHLLTNGKLLASSEIAAQTGFSTAKTIRLLNSLLEKKCISVTGRGRGTKYSV